VHRISVLPDAQNRWMNPDLKVYATVIYIDGAAEWLKPGMSAEVEIIVDNLEDVVQVPLQAVNLESNEQVCYVNTAAGPQRRVVETGPYSSAMIVINKGVSPGEEVLLRSPKAPEKEGAEKSAAEGKNGDKKKPEKTEKDPPAKNDAAPAPKEGGAS